MEILKGQVRDPGYPDCECTYAKTNDGQLYYFIKDGELSNQNIIVTSILKEAIGHAPYTSLGLINSNGDILIPFENKAITKLDEELLLVEKNVPVTQSVVDAINSRSDPFAATNLVNTANAIKEQMKSVMGYSAEFVFDNQFSEAALYNIQGQNIGGAYFSFIARDDFGNYYMSNNVLNSQIVKYDPSLIQNQTPPPQVPDVSTEQSNNQLPSATTDSNQSSMTDGILPNEQVSDGSNQESSTNSIPSEVQADTPNFEMPNIDIPIQNQMANTQETGDDVQNTDTSDNNVTGIAIPGVMENFNNVDEKTEGSYSDSDNNTDNVENSVITDNNWSVGTNFSNVEQDNSINRFDSTEENVSETEADSGDVDADSSTDEADSTEENVTETEADSGDVDADSSTDEADSAEESISDTEADSSDVDADSSTDEADSTEENVTETEADSGDVDADNSTDEADSTEENVTETEADSGDVDADNSTDEADSTEENVSDTEADSDDVDADNSIDEADDTEETVPETEADSSDVEEDNSIDEADDTEENVSDTEADSGDVDADNSIDEADDTEETVSDTSDVEDSDSIDSIENDEITNPVIFNATNTIRKLLEENRNQRGIIEHQADELENMKSSNEILLTDNKSKDQELKTLRKSMSRFRGKNSSLSRENTKLKSINERQEKTIENLKNQNQTLKEQVAGISALGSAVAEANTVIGIDDEENEDDSLITYDTDLSYLGDSDDSSNHLDD